MKRRTVIQICAYYLLPISLVVMGVLVPSNETFKTYGSWTLWLLSVIVFVKPLAVLTKVGIFREILSYRRELGVASMWTYLAHSQGLLAIGWVSVNEIWAYPTFLFWGALAGLGMLILGLTANTAAVRLLKKNWKLLHRLVYPVYFMALYHSSYAEGEMARFYILGGAYALLKALEWTRTPARKS